MSDAPLVLRHEPTCCSRFKRESVGARRRQGLTQFGDPALFEAIISTYQRFSREPTRENLEMMQWQYCTMAESHDEHIDDLLGIMALGAECFDRFHGLAEFTGTDELYVATMTAIVAQWRNRTDDDFAVFHDDSAHFFRQRQMWDAITRADAPEEVHRSGWGGDVRFPLRVTSTAAVNSKDSAAIQLCDVIAGISVKFHDDRVQGEERAALIRAIEAGAGDIEHNGIRFEPDFNAGPPPIRNGPDAIDRMMGVMFPERGPAVGGPQG